MGSTYLLTFLVTLVLVVGPAQQGVAHERVTKLDVKTSFVGKKGIQHLKAGVIAALKASPLYATVETGEDYSLWITDASKRPVDGRGYLLVVVLELRTPARFRYGKLLASREVVVIMPIRLTPKPRVQRHNGTEFAYTGANMSTFRPAKVGRAPLAG
jgi:hypothetical protein